MSTSKARIQNYLRTNQISELFEEMMGKLIKDLPASPVYYLVNFLQEKEKKVKQIVRGDTTKAKKEKKLELTSNAKLWATAPTPIEKATSPRESSPQQPQNIEGRKYEKPWLTHSKKSPVKSKSEKLNQTTPAETSKSGKQDWSQKTKISSEKLDDVIDGDDGVDLGLVYAKPKIVGKTHVKIRSAEEAMQDELSLSGTHKSDDSSGSGTTHKKVSAKEAKKKRQEELKRLAESTHAKSKPRSNSPIVVDDGAEDDALEVLENADELIGEGVKNPPKTGVVVSRSGERSKEEIELVLNMSKFFDELGGMDGINQAEINGSDVQNKLDNDDEDFESASQVTGPRRPVWEAPESEVESVASQLRSARIGVESFVRPDSAGKPQKDPKPEKTKRKTSEPRPRTAPSRSQSDVDMNLRNGSGRETYRVTDPKLVTSPRSRPTTPKGSVVGSASQTKKNGSVKEKEKRKKKTSERANDEPDGKRNQS